MSAPQASEHSLVAFTLLAQLAVGVTWFLSLTKQVSRGALAVIAIVMLVALLASFVHLGQPRHAWRALANLRTSWLSREVLSASLFVAALLAALVTGGKGAWTANVTGLALIISMAQVYRLRTVPEWNRHATTASFLATTLLLGSLLGSALIAAGSGWAFAAMVLIVLRLLIGWREPHTLQRLRAAAIIALLATRLTPLGWWAALALAATAEVMARRQFYATRAPRSAWRFAAPAAEPR